MNEPQDDWEKEIYDCNKDSRNFMKKMKLEKELEEKEEKKWKKEKRRKRSNPLDGDQIFLRKYIMYQFFERNTLAESYENFLRSFGDEVMKYEEFQFWFSRFSNGNIDLQYERKLDTKHPEFMDLPDIALKAIVQKVSWTGIIALRQVSRTLLNFVDSMDLVFEEGSIAIFSNSIEFSIDEDCKKYEVVDDDLWEFIWDKEHEYHMHLLVQDLKLLTQHPRLHVKKLSVTSGFFDDEQEINQMNYFLEEKEHVLNSIHLKVKRLQTDSCDLKTSHFMKMLEPGFLEEIEANGIEVDNMAFGLEQWEQARTFISKDADVCAEIKDPMKALDHFKKIHFACWNVKNDYYMIILKKFLELPYLEEGHVELRDTNGKLSWRGVEGVLKEYKTSRNRNKDYIISAGNRSYTLTVSDTSFKINLIH